MRRYWAAFLLYLPAVQATEYFVSPNGSDTHAGTAPEACFRTIGRAATVLAPGDTCWLRGGVYREHVGLTRSGQAGKPITFAAYNHEAAILDGSDVVEGPWTQAEGSVWKTPVTGPVEAVFCDGQLMTEARWPNCSLSQNWQPEKKWAYTDPGSTLGRLQSAEIARSGQDFTGGLVYLKLSKGNSCYTRRVLSHHAGSPTVVWDASGLPSGPPHREWREDGLPIRIEKFGLAGNRFFIAAAGALNAPEEWWYDASRQELRFVTPDGAAPGRHVIAIKRRISAFAGEGMGEIAFRGLEFRGCNLRFSASRHIQVDSCRFFAPAMLREFPNETAFQAHYAPLWLAGEGNVVEHCEIAWALDSGLVMEGSNNRVEDCVVHDVNLDGRHPGPAISVAGSSVIRRCTVYNFGGVGIYPSLSGPALVDHNNLFNGGLYCVDVSSFYIPTGQHMGGTVVDHNWFHDQHGIGFRVDQAGHGITFHHNLAWNTISGCKLEGTLLCGFNNTVLADNPISPFMVVYDPEISAADRARWRIQNNAAVSFIDRLSLRDESTQRERIVPLASRPGAIDHNVAMPVEKFADYFVNPTADDFRPKPGGPLDRTGVVVAGVTESAETTPSVGALDPGVEPWIAGADWLPGQLAVPRTPHAASELARSLRPANLLIGRDPRQNEPQ